jgi:hypothetical protein
MTDRLTTNSVSTGLPVKVKGKQGAAEAVVEAARDLLDDPFADGDQTFLREELKARIADFDRAPSA